jgi:hypothetical protein
MMTRKPKWKSWLNRTGKIKMEIPAKPMVRSPNGSAKEVGRHLVEVG